MKKILLWSLMLYFLSDPLIIRKILLIDMKLYTYTYIGDKDAYVSQMAKVNGPDFI